MSTPKWQPGTQYIPGSIVTPRSNAIVISEQPNNNSFEDGLTHWTQSFPEGGSGTTAASSAQSFDGTQSASFTDGVGTDLRTSTESLLINDFMAAVTPGQVINFQCYLYRTNVASGGVAGVADGGARIYWYNSSMELISFTPANNFPGAYVAPPPLGTPAGFVGGSAPFASWVLSVGKGIAPAGAAYAAAAVIMRTNNTGGFVFMDLYTWDYTHQGYPSGLVFVAVQANPGISATTEPAWPVMSGVSVVDNTVTWEAEYASSITWTAESILKSGGSEPTWPTTMGASIVDGSIVWTASDGRITDPNCPQSKVVTIGSAKVFAADNDIVRFSATANATDWSSSNDAGFIPFGLQAYGNEPCLMLGLYRSNLIAANTNGYQMWQIDPDPANIAILDAEPVGCAYNKSAQPVNNDFVFLSPVGLRNIGTAGTSGNLQAGQFGKQVDPIVQAFVKQILAAGLEPRGLFFPGTGQYWLMLGSDVIVLTINGASTMSWSRYTFPDVLTDWTVMNGILYLRSAGDLVWQMDPDTLVDDYQDSNDYTLFLGSMSWNYIECGALGVDKMFEGFDLTIGTIDYDGQVVFQNNVVCNVSFGYNQSNPEFATEPFAVTGDSIPGTMIPMPMVAPSFQPRLDFGGGQDWGWGAINLYVKPLMKP